MWDLGKFDTTPFFIGYCEKGYRDNTLTVIGSFLARDEFRGKHARFCWSAACVMGRQSNSLYYFLVVTLGNL